MQLYPRNTGNEGCTDFVADLSLLLGSGADDVRASLIIASSCLAGWSALADGWKDRKSLGVTSLLQRPAIVAFIVPTS